MKIKIAVLALWFCAAAAFADTVYLKSGEEVHGQITGVMPDMILIETDSGEARIIEMSEVERYEQLPAGGAAAVPSAAGAKPQWLHLRINPLMEFDYRDRDFILGERQRAVEMYPDLFDPPYEPDKHVFGQMEGNKLWWGILGISYYGNTDKSTAGESEESRFILNPFILVGLDDPRAYQVMNPALKPKSIYPKPVILQIMSDRSRGLVRYNMLEMLQARQGYHQVEKDGKWHFDLMALNARDFGYKYLFMDLARSRKISAVTSSAQPVQNRYYVHAGPSCGQAGGCNNTSPRIPELEITLDGLPAEAVIKLWKEKPENAEQAADMEFTIEMV